MIIVYSLATGSGSGLNYTGYNPSKYNSPATSVKPTEMREEVTVDGILYIKESDQNAYYVATATDYWSLTPDVPETVIVRDNIDGYPVVRIGWEAFYYNNVTTYVEIPDSVTRIDVEAFYGCKKLQEVRIGNGTQYIFSYAFSACRNLESVYIGSGVTNIFEEVFGSCDKLTSITIYGKQHWKGIYKNVDDRTYYQELYAGDPQNNAATMKRYGAYQWVRQSD